MNRATSDRIKTNHQLAQRTLLLMGISRLFIVKLWRWGIVLTAR